VTETTKNRSTTLRSPSTAFDAFDAAGLDVSVLTPRTRRYIARRLRSVVAMLPARDGPNRATARDLLVLAELLERDVS
jgi:hypothetical protein